MLFETQKRLLIDVGHLPLGKVDEMFRLVNVFSGICLWRVGFLIFELLLLIWLLLLFDLFKESLFGVLLKDFFEPVVKEYRLLVT